MTDLGSSGMGRFRRSIERFRADPASIKNATIAIIMVTAAVVFLGAVVVRIFDRQEYPSFGQALWFTLQTVTTVGYGDVTPERMIGRIVAGVVMLAAIGLITVVTASITSLFVESARSKFDRSQQIDSSTALARLEASLEEINGRLDRLESTLSATPLQAVERDDTLE
jgi:voltage-gated potassium channel